MPYEIEVEVNITVTCSQCGDTESDFHRYDQDTGFLPFSPFEINSYGFTGFYANWIVTEETQFCSEECKDLYEERATEGNTE